MAKTWGQFTAETEAYQANILLDGEVYAGVDASSLDPNSIVDGDLAHELFSGTGGVKDSFNTSVDSTVAAIGGAFSVSNEELNRVGAATQTAIGNATQKRLEELRSTLTRTRKVKLKALLDIGASTAITPQEFAEALGEKTNKFVKTLPGVIKRLSYEFALDVASDPAFIEALSSLETVQRFAKAAEAFNQLYESSKAFAMVFDELFPLVDIAVDTALMVASGGTAGQKITMKIQQFLKIYTARVLVYLLGELKARVYDIQVTVPEIMLGALESFSSKEIHDRTNEWLASTAQTTFGASTINSYQTEKRAVQNRTPWVRQTLGLTDSIVYGNAVGNKLADKIVPKITSKFGAAFVSGILRGNALTATLMKPVTENSYWAARRLSESTGTDITTSKPSALVTNVLSERDIQSFSRVLVDALDTTGSFYVDYQMQRFVVKDLLNDGIIASTEIGVYDPDATEVSPDGFRKSFKQVNDLINKLHRLLEYSIGEKRPCIYESIPVVDFYRKSLTNFDYVYTDSSHRYIEKLERSSNDYATNINNAILEDSPHLLNLALVSNPPDAVAEYFFNTKKTSSPKATLVCAWPQDEVEDGHTKITTTAPGLLVGRYSWVSLRDAFEDPAEWTWYCDESTEVPLGVMHNPKNLLANGNAFIREPLATSNPSYNGKGTETATTIINWLPGFITSNSRAVSGIHSFVVGGASCIGDASADMLSSSDLSGVLRLYPNATIDSSYTEVRDGERDEIVWSFFRGKHKKRVPNYRTEWTYTVKKALYPNKLAKLSNIVPNEWTQFLSTEEGQSGYTLTLNMYTDNVICAGKGMPGYALIAPLDQVVQSILGFTSSFQGYRKLVTTTTPNTYYGFGNSYSTTRLISEDLGDGRTRDREVTYDIKAPCVAIQTPLDLVQNIVDGPQDVYVYSPSSQGLGSNGELYIISKNDLGIEPGVGSVDKIVTLFGEDGLFAVECVEATLVNPYDLGKIVLTFWEKEDETSQWSFLWKTVTKEFTADKIIYDLEDLNITEDPTTREYTTDQLYIHKIGEACWVYKLQAIDVGNSELQPSFTPYSYPSAYFTTNTKTKICDNTVSELKDAFGLVGIPLLETGQSYADITVKGKRLSGLDNLFDVSNLNRPVYDLIKNLPFVRDADSNTLVTVDDMVDVLSVFIEATTTIETMSTASDDYLTNFCRIMIPRWRNIRDAIVACRDGGLLKIEEYVQLDALLGNSLATASKNDSWVGYQPIYSIRRRDSDVAFLKTCLEKIASEAKKALEGSGQTPIQKLSSSSPLEGNPDNLYFQRYSALSARLHKVDGFLSKAATNISNWGLIQESNASKIASYSNVVRMVRAEPVIRMDELVVKFPEAEGDTTKWFYKDSLQAVQDAVSNKCLLTCGECNVKLSCPYYDETAMLEKMTDLHAQTINLYLKDNQLEFLVYDSEDTLPLFDKSGARLNTTTLKKAHDVYTHILRSESDYSIEALREDLYAKFPDFKKGSTFIDSMDWISGGRYGSVEVLTNTQDSKTYTWLYDAVFVRDTESCFVYTESSEAYPVTVSAFNGNEVTEYKGSVKILEPTSLNMFEGVSLDSEVYLASDDEYDIDGNLMTAAIYLGKISELEFDFVSTIPNSKVAQFAVNSYNQFDSKKNKLWMREIEDINYSTNEVSVIKGRERVSDVVELIYEKQIPDPEEAFRGKPILRNYENFIRRIRFNLSSIRWVRDPEAPQSDIIQAQKRFAAMKTNIRLVVAIK